MLQNEYFRLYHWLRMMNEEDYSKNSAKLFWNVQFIYELVLAKMELDSSNVKYTINSNLRSFDIKHIQDVEFLRNRTAYFEEINGLPTLYNEITKKNVTRSINQYLTHWFYPYKGKFHPQMIRALLNIMRIKKGETVLDPFVGSGTLALEAQLMGINTIGIDISEVCSLISRVKTQSLKWLADIQKEYKSLTESIEKFAEKSEDKIIEEISKLVDTIKIQELRNFFLLAKLISHSDKSRRSKKSFKKSFETNIKRMIESLEMFDELQKTHNLILGNTDVSQADVRNLKLPASSIDGVVTSPPYSIALDYVENDKHALSALGYNLDTIRNEFIGLRGKGKSKIDLYNQDMKLAYQEIDRVLKENKYCTIIIGNAILNKREIKTVELTIDIFENLGYTLVKNVDKIIFGLYNIMQAEKILVFKKS